MIVQDVIMLQVQPTGDTCESACIAMITGRPVSDVIAEFHDHYCRGTLEPMQFFIRHSYYPRPCKTTERYPKIDRVYMVTVPSLNNRAVNHCIVWDCRDDVKIFDPNQGRPNMRYYTLDNYLLDNDPLAYQLRSYCLEFEFQ